MLFLYPDVAPRAFWMNEMLIPLDIVWINGGRVAEVWAGAPPPAPGEAPAQRRGPEADMVLEIPAGSATAAGLEVGDTVGLPAALDLRAAAR